MGDLVTTDWSPAKSKVEYAVLRVWQGQGQSGWLVSTNKHDQLDAAWFKPVGRQAKWARTNKLDDSWEDDIPF